ncbi:hypothetical protein [Coralliovum pocilloporae]|uniref:hypothetical protein n=1 Tax=Coralliovum pocilloporae TaxID=3066369 RepID=UPI00330725F0
MADIWFHTAESNADLIKGILPDPAGVAHVVRPDLLARAVTLNGLDEKLRTDVRAAFENELSSSRLICTCSSLGPVADDLAGQGHDVLRLDRVLAGLAADCGGRVSVLYAAPSTRDTTEDIFQAAFRATDRTGDISVSCVDGAWDLFLSGRIDLYLERIADRARNELKEARLVVLAQLSMSRVVDLFPDEKRGRSWALLMRL